MTEPVMTVEELFPAEGTITDHIASKEMWAGSIDRIMSEEIIAEKIPAKPGMYTVTKRKISVSPALVKMFDEPVVNCADHLVRMLKVPLRERNPVTRIKFAFGDAIALYNDGQGVPTDYHRVAKMYTPQLIFGEAFKGSNLKKETKLNIGGGTNGIGVKITNTHSEYFALNTVYENATTRKYIFYRQVWKDGMKIVGEPQLVEFTSLSEMKSKVPTLMDKYNSEDGVSASFTKGDYSTTFTQISFVPKYQRFGYDKCNSEDMIIVEQLFTARMFMLAAYAGWYGAIKGNSVDVYVAGKILPVKSMRDLASYMFNGSGDAVKIVSAKSNIMANSDAFKPYPWEIVVAVNASTSALTTHNAFGGKKNKDDFARISNVNSVVVSGGNHLNKFRDSIIKKVREKLSSDIKVEASRIAPASIYKNIYLFVNATIPDVSWGGGQTKESIQIDRKKISAYEVPYEIISEICATIGSNVYRELFPAGETIAISSELEDKLSRQTLNIPKYTPAKFSGPKRKQACMLLIAEGDSAMSSCKNAMAAIDKKTKKPILGFENYGIYTFGGNVINARKNLLKDARKGSSFAVAKVNLSEKLEKNEFFSNFLKISGLRFDRKYDPDSPNYLKEIKELNYDACVVCTDQDHDGVGKIFTLFSNMIEVFWPNLIKNGYVKRLLTPSRRAYPKKGGQVIEFYTDDVYNAWANEDPSKHNKSNYKIKFVKGLATNEKHEMQHIFKNFHKRLQSYYSEEDTSELFEIHFGHDADKRKDVLATPVKLPSAEKLEYQARTNKISFSDHLNYERKEFMFQDIVQKLWNKYDGFNEVGRKIACGLLKWQNAGGKEKRVYEAAAYIMGEMKYHHGDKSLQESIFSMGFTETGGVQLPLVVLYGEGGTCGYGGSDHGSARYVTCKPNKKLLDAMYPKDLVALAKNKLEDGVEAEKELLLGIIPRGVCESAEIPSNGYKIKVYARDVFNVISNVKFNILKYKPGNTETIASQCGGLNPYSRGFKGTFKPIKGMMHSFGVYTYDEGARVLRITELPLRVWHEKYVQKLADEKTFVRRPGSDDETDVVRIISGKIYNTSSDGAINIEITIAQQNNGWDPIDIINRHAMGDYYNGIEGFFKLRKHMDSHIFMTRMDGSVETKYKSYSQVIEDWFPVAKENFIARVDREEAIKDLKVRCLRQHVRYIEEYDSLGITKAETDEANKILIDLNYTKYNYSYLSNVTSGSDTAIEIYGRVLPETDGTVNPDASFDYLYKTTDYDKHKAPLEKKKIKLAEWEHDLSEYRKLITAGGFRGARLWIRELEELSKVCKEGFATNWKFGESNKYTYGGD